MNCPITLEPFVFPIMLPDCGHTIEKSALQQHFATDRRCPVCRTPANPDFNPDTAPRNFAALPRETPVNRPQFAAIYRELADNIGQLQISLQKSLENVSKSLFIAVVDNSGSMSGTPWKQVQKALCFICEKIRLNPLVAAKIIAYNSYATTIELTGNSQCDRRKIMETRTGGGTQVATTFPIISQIIADSHPGVSISIAFMTDGQDSDFCINTSAFSDKLSECIPKNRDITVHSIGFSGDCDKNLLETIRKSGTKPGTFRYAEPSDGDEELCNKIQGVFAISSAKVPIILENVSPLPGEIPEISLNSQGKGRMELWMYGKCPGEITFRTRGECHKIAVTRENPDSTLLKKWVNRAVGETAKILLNPPQICRRVFLSIIRKRIAAMNLIIAGDESATFSALVKEFDNLWEGNEANAGKLQDLQYSGRFAAAVTVAATRTQGTRRTRGPTRREIPAFKEEPIRYNMNPSVGNRSQLQQEILRYRSNILTPDFAKKIRENPDIFRTDDDGNNILHIAALCGQNHMIPAILARGININATNNDGETALTIAIKKRGFWKSAATLIENGAKMPANRGRTLVKFAADAGFLQTARLIRAGSTEVSRSMTTAFFRQIYGDSPQNVRNSPEFLDIALSKNLLTIAEEIMKSGVKPTLEMLYEHAFPPKADHPDVDRYIRAAKLLTFYGKFPANAANSAGETALFRAVESGNLPLVKYFVGCGIDTPNSSGNTPLWLACSKRYPCIVEYLLEEGADPNAANKRQNTAIFPICQRGPAKLADVLLSYGADIQRVNDNGDSPIHLCCRNGQPDVLRVLIPHVSREFAAKFAKIDGFSPIQAAAEADRAECIQVLHEFGVDMEQKTSEENPIIAGATALHIAAYYGRNSAINMLISSGANANCRDIGGRTPLHIAVMQNNAKSVELLCRHCDVSLLDDLGNSPQFYARSPKIRRAFVDPLWESAVNGIFAGNERQIAQIFRQFADYPALTNAGDLLDISSNGRSLLTMSIICSCFTLTKTLIDLGVDVNKKSNGVYPMTWALWISSARYKDSSEEVSMQLSRIQAAARNGNRPALYIGRRPSVGNQQDFPPISRRIAEQFDIKPPKPEIVEWREWMSKIHTVEKIATGLCTLSAKEELSLQKFRRMLRPNPRDFAGALRKLRPFRGGEVYVGLPGEAGYCRRLKPGQILETSFLASTSWKIAADAAGLADGTVFIIHPGDKCRDIGNGEIVFMPTKFRVLNWYKADQICLGQKNVRKSTYLLDPESTMPRALIVELSGE